MSEVNEQAAARDATNWAKKVSTLNVSEVPEGAINLNVEGRRLASPIPPLFMYARSVKFRTIARASPVSS